MARISSLTTSASFRGSAIEARIQTIEPAGQQGGRKRRGRTKDGLMENRAGVSQHCQIYQMGMHMFYLAR
jgi:hypothetical protein